MKVFRSREGEGQSQRGLIVEIGMESMLRVVVQPRPESRKMKWKKKKNARDVISPSSSSHYPSMPRYPPSPSHGDIDVSEIRTATFKVRIEACMILFSRSGTEISRYFPLKPLAPTAAPEPKNWASKRRVKSHVLQL